MPAERIKAVNHHLRVALDEVSEAVLILQNGFSPQEGPVIAWGNAAAVRCTGIAAADLFGSPLQPLLTPCSWRELMAALSEAFSGGPAPCDLTFLHPDTKPQRGRITATRGPQGEILGVILTLSEIPAPAATASVAPSGGGTGPPLQLPLPSPQGWQEDVIETIRETARQVAHEFNNALTSIVLPVQLAIRAIPRNGDLYDSLEVAHVSAQRASDLAKDFLDCFRPRSAVRSRCAPGALLGRSIRLATCAQNVSASLDLDDDLPEIEVDESQLERVIFNLIRNSVQAMPNGGRLRVAASRRDLNAADGVALPPGTYIQIALRDWGPGIAEEHLQHLFHGRFTTKPEGNGCGLPICYQIVREHGGEMLVRSRLNVGTEFFIYLPALPPLGAECPAPPLPPTGDFHAGPAIPAPPVQPALPALVPLVPALDPLVPLITHSPAPVWPAPAASAAAFHGESTAPVAPPAYATPAPAPAGEPAARPAAAFEDALPSLLVVDDEQGGGRNDALRQRGEREEPRLRCLRQRDPHRL